MPKKLSELQKKEMIDSFVNGKSIDQLSEIYNYSRNTIIRHLKGGISKDKYKFMKKYEKLKPLIIKITLIAVHNCAHD